VIDAHLPIQRPRDARLLVVDALGRLTHAPRSQFVDFLRRGDLVVANDAATLPASLTGVHLRTGATIEVRLAGRSSLDPHDVQFTALVFGEGDFRIRTEDRPLPPPLAAGDRLELGSLRARVVELLDHPRMISVIFEGHPDAVWAALARDGRPIQYAHVRSPLAPWDVNTRIAGVPVAFEAPSAGFVLDWSVIASLRQRGIGFATVTLAAGISSTGDHTLDRRLPFNEPYRIPHATADAIRHTRLAGRRIVAIGTTVVRALEHAARGPGVVRAGEGVATQRLGPGSRLEVVDAILSGTHEAATSHYQLLRAFAPDETLLHVDAELEGHAYRTHEFGDSVLIEKTDRAAMSGLGSGREAGHVVAA
jgi:S-adenosylmethionine:tRNA ribosyltransferase-isomerase